MTYFFKTEHGDYINSDEVHHFCVKKVQTGTWEIRAYLKTFVQPKERDYISIHDYPTEEKAMYYLDILAYQINDGD